MRHELFTAENGFSLSDDIRNIKVSIPRQRCKLLPTAP